MRTNKKKGGLIFAFGFLAVLASIFSDYIRHRPISFGKAQIALLAFGIILIVIGLYIAFRQDFKLKDVWFAVRHFTYYKTISTVLMFCLIALLLIHPLQYLFNWLSYPYPVNYRDVGEVYPAVAMSQGINPYSIESYPQYMFVYGAMFEFVILPFIGLTTQPLLVAHWVMVVFLAAFLALAFWYFRKRKASVLSSLVGVLVFLNAVCFLWHLDGIRPDTLALFFGYAAFYIFFKKKISTFDLFLSALFCVFCFYLKQYLLFSAAIIAVYLFLFNSKLKSLLYVLFTAVLGIGSFLLFCHFFPMYFNYSIIHHLTMYGGNNIEHMYMQSKDFFRFFWPLLLFSLIVLHKKLSSFDFKSLSAKTLFSLKIKQPLISGVQIDFWILGFLGAILVLTFWLGRHSLSYYSYYVELLLPYLVFLVIPEIDQLLPDTPHKIALQLIIMGFCLLPFNARYVLNAKAASQQYQQFFAQAEQCTNIYDTNPLAAVYKLNRGINPIYNNGQTEYADSVAPGK